MVNILLRDYVLKGKKKYLMNGSLISSMYNILLLVCTQKIMLELAIFELALK